MSDFNFEGTEYNMADLSPQVQTLVSRATKAQSKKETIAEELDIFIAAEAKLIEMIREELEAAES